MDAPNTFRCSRIHKYMHIAPVEPRDSEKSPLIAVLTEKNSAEISAEHSKRLRYLKNVSQMYAVFIHKYGWRNDLHTRTETSGYIYSFHF
ncbi:hypothetical protein AB6A40_007363 [Gnathostoma spinigerum]|uniref:Uncharacterized protein n=1 Tax=Gnathostoma spinigerum TaxID=75299 RepID=A0ABD6EL08_9BILA